MNIVLDNIIFSLQKRGGISVVWSEFLKRIILQKDFSVSFIEYNNAQSNFFRKELSLDVKQKISTLLFFKRYINPSFHMESPYIFHSSYYRVCCDPRAKNVTTVHDFTYEYFFKRIAKSIHSWQKEQAIIRSQKVICISENTKQDLLRFLPQVSSDKICVIYNGVNKEFHPIPRGVEYDMQLPFDRHNYLLFVGARGGYKNFEIAVDAARLVKLPLIIAGGGILTSAEIEKLNKIVGHSNYCYLGFVDNEQLNVLYNNAFCLLYPSSYEGFGIPVIEAQKAGCPVIACYKSSIPEIIGNTKIRLEKINANIIAETIQSLISSTREYEIKQGLINAERFSWDITFQKTIQLYRSLM